MKKYNVLHGEQIVGTFSEALLSEQDRAEVAEIRWLRVEPVTQEAEGEVQHG